MKPLPGTGSRPGRILRAVPRWVVPSLVAVALLAVSIPTGKLSDRPATTLLIACCLLGGAALLWPAVAGALIGVCLTLLVFTESQIVGLAMLAPPIAVVACGAQGRRLVATLYTLWYFAASVTMTVQSTAPERLVASVVFLLVYTAAPPIAGEIILRVSQRQDRQRADAAEAITEQRLAIARELHDTLAYATTTMVMKAEEARLRGGQDAATLADLEYIARTGRAATSHLRTMLGLLRDVSAIDGAPVPEISDPLAAIVQAQVDKLDEFGFVVECSLEGDLDTLPEGVRQLAARVISEGASNICKHGDTKEPARIMVEAGTDELEVVLVNAPGQGGPPPGHSGLGLIGLRELAGASGGELTAERVGQHWITQLTVPLRRVAGVG
ncbi:hypothetical protein HJ590_11185 [Naumannella sp. ID2617S]|uniref:histidine kinase n=1 Tax=Enemella dayhoffiae TaxID=2016507 RepID=A0A255HCA2_9ACTN|nr:histidine kinase [Enemella dayhoffiae]NNG20126.1 hypothetical protein [Naumannella sp. ID2617S]OYO25327.1 hypothetical protein CGZ93_02490 [Enemella dayhoffiae]